MRKLLCFSAGFSGACAFGAYVCHSLWLIFAAVLILVVAVFLLRSFRHICWQRRLAIVLSGLAVGFCWFSFYSSVSLRSAREADGSKLHIKATATDYSYDTGYGTAVIAEVALDDDHVQAILYLNGTLSVSPGDVLDGMFYLKFTGTPEKTESNYYRGAGLFLRGYQRGELTLTVGDRDAFSYFPARLRKSILERMDEMFPADTRGFAKALLLGDRSGIDYETNTSLTLSGIVHVVSVSGLHISILFSVLFLFLGRRRLLTPILGGAVLLVAAAVTGFSPSIVRSCLMNGLMLLALMLDREYDPLTAVGFSLLVMLGFNPMAVTSVGLQLSAASVIGISLMAQPICDWLSSRNFWADAKKKSVLGRFRDGLSASVGVSMAATVATAPLTALHFGSISLVGWLTNLLGLWLVNIVFVGVLACVIIGALWQAGGAWLAGLLSIGIRLVLWISGMVSKFPLAAIYTESPYVFAWLIFAYGMLIVFLTAKFKHRLQLLVWTGITLVAAVGFSWVEPRMDDFRMTAIDVGQGQCIVLQSDGRTYMVDCGGSGDTDTADRAVAVLRSQGVFRLDGLIITHYDRDHAGAVPYLLTQMPVNSLYLPEGDDFEAFTASLDASAFEKLFLVEKDEIIQWENTQIQLFAFAGLDGTNESSTCVLFQKENCDILITGDQSQLGEMALLYQNDIPKVDVLVVGHHGAKSSTSMLLLEHIRPTVAVISVGANNHYDHPHLELLERLELFGCQIRRTDLEGTIIIKR